MQPGPVFAPHAMQALATALVLALPAVVTAKALMERRRAQATRRWPTTAAQLVASGDAYSYVVRGETHRLELDPRPEPDEQPPSPSVRVHYDPGHPEGAVLTDAALPSLVEPIATSWAVAVALLATVKWLA